MSAWEPDVVNVDVVVRAKQGLVAADPSPPCVGRGGSRSQSVVMR
jgi:hypothetical protein